VLKVMFEMHTDTPSHTISDCRELEYKKNRGNNLVSYGLLF